MPTDFVSRGQALVTSGQYQEAVKVCRLGLLGRPSEVGGRVVLGHALLALRRYDEVLAEMRVALDLEPSNAAAHQLRGEALLRKGDAHGAAEALGRAVALSPDDAGVAALAAEAGRAASSTGARRPAIGFGDAADSMTRHYPSSPSAQAKPPDVSFGGVRRGLGDGGDDGTGTLEIDPGRDSVRIDDEDDDDDIVSRFDLPPRGAGSGPVPTQRAAGSPSLRSAASPASRGGTVDVNEDDVIAVEAGEVLARGSASAALRGPSVIDDYEEDQATIADAQPHRRVAALTGADLDSDDELTGEPDERKPTADVDRSATSDLVAQLDGDLDADTTGSINAVPAASLPAARLPASRLPIEAPPTRELPGVGTARAAGRAASPGWPEPEGDAGPARAASPRWPSGGAGPGSSPGGSGGSGLYGAGGTGGSGGSGLYGAGSSGSSGNRPMPRAPSSGDERARDEDMRTIRAGLGLGDSSNPANRAARPSAPGVGIAPPAKARVRGERTRKVRTDPRGIALPPPPRPGMVLALWIGLAVAVIGAGIWGGFAIRDVRLSRQIAAARHAAVGAAASDTWPGWRAARDLHAGIVEARDTVENVAAVARARAVLAGEFGDDLAGARKAVGALGDVPEAAVPRGFLAIADGDPAAAGKAAEAARAAAPGDGAPAYLAGRAALLDDRPDVAVESFRAALRAENRPLYYLGLVEAEIGRRNWPEAKAAVESLLQKVPDHPGATIARARALAASGALAEGVDPALPAALDRLLAEGERPAAGATVSPAEAAMAGLALAEVFRATGDVASARRAMTRALALGSEQRRFAEDAVPMLVSVDDIATAAKLADAAVARFPASSKLRGALAEIALRNGNPAKALAALADAGDLSQRPEALAVRGRAKLAQGDLEGAAKDLDAAVAKAPELEAAVIARAELDLARGDARAAAQRLEPRYRAAAPLDLSIAYATALREVGERERARGILERLTAEPGTVAGRAWLELARVERDGGTLKAARAAYARAIEATPAPATEPRLEAALLALDASDPVGARDALDRLVAERPGDGRLMVESARAHLLLGDLAGAKALLDKAEPVASAPRWLLARERGRLALRQRRAKDAIQTLERASGLAPEDGETRLLLVDAHLAADDADAARRALTDLQKRFAGRAEALLARGRIEYYVGRNKEARAAFGQARDRLVKDKAVPRRLADALAWLGRVAYEEQDRAASRALLRQALTLDPSSVDAWTYAGFVEEERKNPRGAASAFEKASQLDPDNVDNWFNLGKAAVDSKQKKLAQDALAEYLKRAPKGPMAEDARKLLAKL